MGNELTTQSYIETLKSKLRGSLRGITKPILIS